jgi:hypothetical protein
MTNNIAISEFSEIMEMLENDINILTKNCPCHPFAKAIKNINQVYQDDEFEFVTSMYKCRYVKTIYPFYIYYFDYVYNNEYSNADKNEQGFIITPLQYPTYDPDFLEYHS